jgi:hypothetical protein
MTQKLLTVAVVAMLGAVAAGGYQLVQSRIAAEVYRDRLNQLGDRYESLRGQYNDAVRQTAVTELLVKDGQLSVIVRSAEGVIQRVPTPYDPTSEIYVDYIVVDGRLWIRRVFNEQTAPSKGTTITPDVAAVDWDNANVKHGKAVYSRLSEGRWRITVTGDGSLGLAKAEGPVNEKQLKTAPKLGEYEPVEQEVDQRLDRVSWSDIARYLLGANQPQ